MSFGRAHRTSTERTCMGRIGQIQIVCVLLFLGQAAFAADVIDLPPAQFFEQQIDHFANSGGLRDALPVKTFQQKFSVYQRNG